MQILIFSNKYQQDYIFNKHDIIMTNWQVFEIVTENQKCCIIIDIMSWL